MARLPAIYCVITGQTRSAFLDMHVRVRSKLDLTVADNNAGRIRFNPSLFCINVASPLRLVLVGAVLCGNRSLILWFMTNPPRHRSSDLHGAFSAVAKNIVLTTLAG
jgi:hypothetical protein